MKVHVSEIDIAKLCKVYGNIYSRALSVLDLLGPFIEKTKPQFGVVIGETDYEFVYGKERGELVAEFNRWIWKTKLPWAVEITAEKWGIRKAVIIYGEWDTLVLFY